MATPVTASNVQEDNLPQDLVKYLSVNPSTQFIKWFWISCNAFLYVRVLTKSRTLSLATKSTPLKVHVSCIGGFTPINSMDATFVSPVGKSSIYPDWKSLCMINPTHASVQCCVSEDLSLYRSLAMPSPFQRCPRSCLNRVLARAQEHSSLVFLAGFELEFYLSELSKPSEVTLHLSEAGPSRTWSSAACMRGPFALCIEACMLALEAAGLVIEQGHAECSPNQYEISIGPLPVMQAVDSLVCAKEIIKEVAYKHGLMANFLPIPFEDREPTGLHLHLSVHQQSSDQGELDVEQLTQTSTRAKHAILKDTSDLFLAGILNRLPMLCAFSLPTIDSYRRISDKHVMGDYVAWGKENQSVPLSQISLGYWEIRSLDWTANIYLATAVYLSAGLLGIKNNEKLRWQDPRNLTFQMDIAALQKLGITEPLPKSFDEAMGSLIQKEYGGLAELLGHEILDLYVIVKEKESEYMKSLQAEDRRILLTTHF